MDIKEIALKVADSLRNKVDGISHMQSNQGLVRFAEALIESYKAELLKEAGEPVLYSEFAEDGEWHGDTSEYADHLEEPHALFTSDQVAAAILKATKPLESEVVKWREASRVKHLEAIDWACKHQATSYQLAKAEQLWQIAQGRCDGLEEKLAKAEQRVVEWQPIETAPKDGTRVLLCIDHGEWGDKVWTGLWGDGWMVSYGKARAEPTHWMPLPKAPNGASS